MTRIILFDGDCHLCNQSVQFIIKRDPKEYFKFASRQSSIGIQLLNQYNVSETIDSVILIDNTRAYTGSDAILNICKYLKGSCKLLFILLIIPKPIRNFYYKKVAENRYKWFGKQNQCLIPTPDIKKRFLR
ncbi:thiol-disulfide oxidoreductase DCC family protein [Bacillus wiedmannii]|uniref:DCC1-like thiol-disulfide oxidoreductase family protein n=1 Tax=Bacillus wiedmannii TaxID=1890302 RepID=A0AA95RZW9_9BACI|nr:DCC1-like thiol-disulfide oxidoreductase family protein [Bacillus wiedmannii]WHY31631.1 DCC1-like thiol-disulfide oxidoreductase family protein [Bacillus wiedmannii]